MLTTDDRNGKVDIELLKPLPVLEVALACFGTEITQVHAGKRLLLWGSDDYSVCELRFCWLSFEIIMSGTWIKTSSERQPVRRRSLDLCRAQFACPAECTQPKVHMPLGYALLPLQHMANGYRSDHAADHPEQIGLKRFLSDDEPARTADKFNGHVALYTR